MNVYLIVTPHQLLNAIEARHYFELEDNHLYIVVSKTYPVELFKPLLDDSKWDSVTFIGKSKKYNIDYEREIQRLSVRVALFRDELLRRKELDKIAASIKGVSTLMVGNYKMNFIKHFANKIHHERLIALDDGTATLRVYNERAEKPNESGRNRMTKRFREFLLGIDPSPASSITFFSTYDLQPLNGDVLVKNEYRHLRKVSANTPHNNAIYFLGQQLVEMKILDEDVYIHYLKQIKEHYGSEQLVYIAHKHEAMGKIERIKNEVGLEIRRFDVPVEYQMSVRGDKPKILAGFSSSAIETCDHIFAGNIKINVFVVNPDHLLNRKKFILSIYDYYKKKNSDHFVILPLYGRGAPVTSGKE